MSTPTRNNNDFYVQKNEAGVLPITMYKHGLKGFSGGPRVKNPPANAGGGDSVLIPKSGRSREGSSNPLQYSCLENPMDRGAWWATVHGITKSQTQLSTGALSLLS